MKEYLKALSALKRICGILRKDLEVDSSTVNYYIDECATKFSSQFGVVSGSAKVLALLDNAKAAAIAGNMQEVVRLVDETGIMY